MISEVNGKKVAEISATFFVSAALILPSPLQALRCVKEKMYF